MLRFGAFSMVFWFHAMASVGGPRILLAGRYGVDLFFALSAYLIVELFRRERERTGAVSVGRFYRRRVLRIWPLYFAFIGTVFAASFVIRDIQMPGLAMISLLTFTTNIYLAAHPFFSPSGILWSLSIEEQFYAVVPWLFRARLLVPVMVGVLIGAPLARWYWPGGEWYGTLTHADPIAAGALLAVFLDGNMPRRPIFARVYLLTIVVVTLCATSLLEHGLSIEYSLVSLCVFGILLATLGARLTWTPLVYLGRISYGLYVFHLLVLDAVKVVLMHTMHDCPWLLRGVIALPITIALAAASYRWLEGPFLRMKERAS